VTDFLHGRHGKSKPEGGSVAETAFNGNLAAQLLD
jgi:hypothetical protein